MADKIGQADIVGENISRAVDGFARQLFKLKQVCLLQTSNRWKETYYKETKTELTPGGEGFAVKGVAPLAAFPHLDPSWTKTSSYHIKHAGESFMSVEDAITDAIDVQARTYERVARAVAYSVDNAIYDAITADANVNTLAASDNWDSATVANRDPIGDILHGIEYCMVDNYDVLRNGYLLVNPENYTNIVMNSKCTNNASFKTADVVSNGVVGQICGLKIIVSSSIDADEACVIQGQKAVVYKTAVPLTAAVVQDPGIKLKIRAWEIGITMITNPEAIHIITNTEL